MAAGWVPAGIANFTGGSISDVLLYNPSNGLVSVWPGGMAASGVVTGQVNIAAGYVILNSFGDFNGDGHDDLIVYSTSNGNVAVWYSANVATSAILGQFVVGWTPYHVADVNGDGLADLILRETDSSGRGTGRYSYWSSGNPANSHIMATPGFPWELYAVGNWVYGTCGLLWYNSYSGQINLSVPCSQEGTLSQFTAGDLLGWPIYPFMAADVNGDGTTDIVAWHPNDTTISIMPGGDRRPRLHAPQRQASTMSGASSASISPLGVYAASSGWAPLPGSFVFLTVPR